MAILPCRLCDVILKWFLEKPLQSLPTARGSYRKQKVMNDMASHPSPPEISGFLFDIP